MAAKKTGGTGARRKAKDSAMAAMMKAQGVERTTMNCPMCHKRIGINSQYSHLGKCQ